MKKILMFVTILVMGFVLVGCTNNSVDDENTLSDALKFKSEYEELNGESTSSGKTYSTLDIEKNNVINYRSSSEIINIIKNGTGIIYFGFPECPWCRTMTPVLLEIAKENDMEVNYLNIYDFRSSFIIEEGKVKQTKEGNKDYYTILELLDNELEDYILKTESGEEIPAGEKRLYAPTAVFVKDGVVKAVHVGTVDSQEDPYVALTSEQREELVNIYKENINKIK
jgi:thiol-disulfide isomerase/thioredoxin